MQQAGLAAASAGRSLQPPASTPHNVRVMKLLLISNTVRGHSTGACHLFLFLPADGGAPLDARIPLASRLKSGAVRRGNIRLKKPPVFVSGPSVRSSVGVCVSIHTSLTPLLCFCLLSVVLVVFSEAYVQGG